MKKVIILLVALVLRGLTFNAYAQQVDWAHIISGDDNMQNDEHGLQTLLDSQGNVYVFGKVNGNSDLDPGAGQQMETLTSYANFFMLKLSADGEFIWVKTWNNCYFKKASKDQSDNFYIIGTSYNGFDMDPNAGVNILNTTSYENFLIKINSSGNFEWGFAIGENSSKELVNDIACDFDNNIYLTGYHGDTTGDFDPGLGVTSFTNNDDVYNMFLARFDNTGTFHWAHSLADFNGSFGNAITCGPDNSPVVSGSFSSVVDFDFGSGTQIIVPGNSRLFLAKFDNMANNIWVHVSENTYAEIFDLHSDHLNQIYTAGTYYTGFDFNWHPVDSFEIANSFGTDAFVMKSDANGNFLWVKGTSSSGMDRANSIDVDSMMNVYVTGKVANTTDFDPTAAIYSLPFYGQDDYYLEILDENGNFVWATSGGDVMEDELKGVAVTKSGHAYCTGFLRGIVDIDHTDGEMIFNTNNRDVFTMKIGIKTPNICMVTVDTMSTHNIIYWDKSLMNNIDTIFVYRETTTNNYNQIAAVPFDSLGMFIDTVNQLYFPYTGDPNMGTYRYKIRTKDKWDGLSQFSPYHNTIFAINIFGTFNWNPYIIEGETTPIPQLGAYHLWRDDNGTGNWNVVGAVAGTQTTITDPLYANFPNGRWRVLTDWSISCDPTRAGVNTSRSNVKNSPGATNTILENGNFAFSVYPNPANDNIFIQSDKIFANAIIRILDITGNEIFHSVLNAEFFSMNISNLANGVYFIRIETELGNHLEKITVE